jgi:carbamate kinase
VLLILTDVKNVVKGFGTDHAEPIERLTVAQASELLEAGEFTAGSMGPKIQAAIEFVDAEESRRSFIGDLEDAQEALAGRAGTMIVP